MKRKMKAPKGMRIRKPRTERTAWMTRTEVEVVEAPALEPVIVVLGVGATMSGVRAVAWTMSIEKVSRVGC